MDDDARIAISRFVAWLDRYGPTSQDQMDLWAFGAGRKAKSLYHRRRGLGSVAVAPLAAIDLLAPSARRFVRRRVRFPIADAHYAMAFLALERIEPRQGHLQRARGFLEVLVRTRCPGFDNYCWGFPFDWETWYGLFEQGRPLITQTPYGYEAFEAADDVSAFPGCREIMYSVGSFAYASIPTRSLGPGVSVSSYSSADHRRVVNANAYRAFLLATAGTRFDAHDWLSESERNLRFVLSCQDADGSFPYGLDEHDGFIDNFHTCFVLKNLVKSWRPLGHDRILEAALEGYGFYKRHLLDGELEPIPFARAPRRITLYTRDLYDYAEGITLALLLRDVDEDAETILRSLVRSLVRDWQLRDGHFLTRKTLTGGNTVPYHRWAQAQAFHALVRYVESEQAE